MANEKIERLRTTGFLAGKSISDGEKYG